MGRSGSATLVAVRVTKAGVTTQCAVCERTLLMGERAVRFSPGHGAELVDVCPLCQEIALEHGWLKEGTPTTPVFEGERRRRRRGLGELLGLSRAGDDGGLVASEPILRRLSDTEVRLLEAADLFNASAYRRTVEGITKSLGEAKASIVPLSGIAGELAITIAWDISWYQYRVSPESAQPVRLESRGHELDELDSGFQAWNARVDDGGRLLPDIEKL